VVAGNFVHNNAGVWSLARAQHDVASREQLLALSLTRHAIDHRIAAGRLHRLWDGVYAIGSPHVGQKGLWMAAVLACGPNAVLSHDPAAALLRIIDWAPQRIHVSVPTHVNRRRRGICVHRRRLAARHLTRIAGIPVTDPILTLVDLAATRPLGQVEATINRADKRDLVDPEALRSALDELRGIPGAVALRRLLDRRTFLLTDSELERTFPELSETRG
jgi:predicted transcriptional regulator of viral defense system